MSKQDFQNILDRVTIETRDIDKVRQISDEVNRKIYEISIKPSIFLAAEKGLYEVCMYYMTLDVYSLCKFLERMGYKTDVNKNTFTISWH